MSPIHEFRHRPIVPQEVGLYVLNTPKDQAEMLAQIGAASVEELLSQVPAPLRLNRALQVPPARSEMELTQHVGRLASQNRAADATACFLGGGIYDHFIPAVVDAVASRSEYYTAYTPYQAEASQGSLQAFFEFQTLICQLTGLDVSNASLYEGGSAVAEAVVMAMGINPKRKTILVPESLHPEYRLTLTTYLANLDARVVTLPTPQGFLDPEDLKKAINDDTLCVVAQHPNFFGCLEEVEALSALAHERGALFGVSYYPISLGLLRRPGDYGADIAVAEGQCLGNPMSYGGPVVGLMSCREEFVRKIPGRIVGQTTDRQGKRCWVLTLQTREQHIRREKATSNICTNQGLFALRAAVFLAALGPEGLRETAQLCLAKAHYLAEELEARAGLKPQFSRPFFNEFTLPLLPQGANGSLGVKDWQEALLTAGYHFGLPLAPWYPELRNCVTVAVTEKRTRTEIDGLVKECADFNSLKQMAIQLA